MDYIHTLIAEIRSSQIVPSGIHTEITILPYIVIDSATILFILLLRKLMSTYMLLKQHQVFLELTPPAVMNKSAYTTQQLISVLHSAGAQKSIVDKLLGRKTLFSFEIVSTKEKGIRYLIRADEEQAHIIERMTVAYLPQVRVRRVEDYITDKNINTKIIEYKLHKHFAFPLAKQDLLNEHDPVAYITAMMTQLAPQEFVALQLVISPIRTNETKVISQKILRNEDVLQYLNAFRFPGYLRPVAFVLKVLVKILHVIGKELSWAVNELVNGSSSRQVQYNSMLQQQNLLIASKLKPARVLSTFEQEAVTSVQGKINQSLFETSLRFLIAVDNKKEQKKRIRGITSSIAPFSVPMYQSLYAPYTLPISVLQKLRLLIFKKRLFSLVSNRSDMLLSVSEIADLYHFPNTSTTRTEDLVKQISPELPVPLILKNTENLDVIFGKNTYNNGDISIGLTDDDRSRHVFISGQTGSGKSTSMFHMIKDDIQKGRGTCVVDPHGDLVEDLLHIIPKERINDIVYFNPFDIKYPMRINLLSLTPGLDEDELELEKEVVCESVISIFRRIFAKDENVDMHRIEYILRNTIYTAFYVDDATIFTLTKLLTNTDFRNSSMGKIEDEALLDFWKEEFGKAGDWQITKMISGVTAKIGRFAFSPITKRILEKPQSTIDIDKLIDQGKIILCNLSEGKLGEDTSHLLGTTIIGKIHLAVLKRARMDKAFRQPFYLFVDEFQNFATPYFVKLLSGGRKYGLRITVAEQSTTQQKDERMVNAILANVGTVICFRTASPIDEELFLPQFSPSVQKGAIFNLPRYRFYMKLGAKDPQEAFSGVTLPAEFKKDPDKVAQIIAASRKNYASEYIREKKETTGVAKPKKNKEGKIIKKGNKNETKKGAKKKKDVGSLT